MARHEKERQEQLGRLYQGFDVVSKSSSVVKVTMIISSFNNSRNEGASKKQDVAKIGKMALFSAQQRLVRRQTREGCGGGEVRLGGKH